MLIRAPFIFRASADIQILDTGENIKRQIYVTYRTILLYGSRLNITKWIQDKLLP